MATDFGDESGEKLFDWMLRVGQVFLSRLN